MLCWEPPAPRGYLQVFSLALVSFLKGSLSAGRVSGGTSRDHGEVYGFSLNLHFQKGGAGVPVTGWV